MEVFRHPATPVQSPLGGDAYRLKFDNGYGASVIRNPYSYGGSQGHWELAVLRGDQITYDTPITSDVEGWLTIEEVNILLDDIKALS